MPPAPQRRSAPAAATHEHRTWAAGVANALAMGVELGGGFILGSAALLAEGWHMGAHVAAMLVAGVGYRLAARSRRRRGELAARRIGDLAGLVNAALLLAIAGLLLSESLTRMADPQPIRFVQAVLLAVFGLLVNVASLGLLHHRAEGGHAHARDLSFRAVYLHMIGDAAVGVASIVGLCLVAFLGWRWADGAAGVGGAVLIAVLALQIAAAVVSTRAVPAQAQPRPGERGD